jgi:hypothetical protein
MIGWSPHAAIAAKADALVMVARAAVLLIAALASAAAGWAAVRARGSVAPSRDVPVVVGSVRVSAAQLETAAARLAGAHPRRLAAARRVVAARAIERLWLEGEARERGLRPAAQIARLRAQVADTLVGPGRVPDAGRLAAVFEAFHDRWRARTRCLAAYSEPWDDRCGDVAAATAGTCRWIGAATVCGVRARWLVVRRAGATRAAAARLPLRLALRLARDRDGVLRLRSRADAVAVARALYVVARAARVRAAAAAKRAEERARLARARAARVRDPRLTRRSLASAADACRRQVRDSQPYLFGFGLQDVRGQTEGLIAARVALSRRLIASAADAIDRRKLRTLVAAIADGNHELQRLANSPPAGDLATLAARVARLDARTKPERAISRRLGLGDCVARPAG